MMMTIIKKNIPDKVNIVSNIIIIHTEKTIPSKKKSRKLFDVLLNIDKLIEPDIRPSLCISNEERTSPSY